MCNCLVGIQCHCSVAFDIDSDCVVNCLEFGGNVNIGIRHLELVLLIWSNSIISRGNSKTLKLITWVGLYCKSNPIIFNTACWVGCYLTIGNVRINNYIVNALLDSEVQGNSAFILTNTSNVHNTSVLTWTNVFTILNSVVGVKHKIITLSTLNWWSNLLTSEVLIINSLKHFKSERCASLELCAYLCPIRRFGHCKGEGVCNFTNLNVSYELSYARIVFQAWNLGSTTIECLLNRDVVNINVVVIISKFIICWISSNSHCCTRKSLSGVNSNSTISNTILHRNGLRNITNNQTRMIINFS